MTAATTTGERLGWSISALAPERLGDRPALGRLLQGIEPATTGGQSEKLYTLRDVVRALTRRAVEGETERLRLRINALEAQLAAGDDQGVSESEARRRKRCAEAALLEMEVATKRQEYVPLWEAEHVVTTFLSGVIQRINGLSSRVAVDVAAEASPPVCQRIIDARS